MRTFSPRMILTEPAFLTVRNRVVFTMGDPNGIGPEILLKALHEWRRPASGEPVIEPCIVGDPAYLRKLRKSLDLDSGLDDIEVIPAATFEFPPCWGRVDGRAGGVAIECLRVAVESCRDRGHRLLVTAPLSKKAVHLAGWNIPGQTEFIASFFPGHEAVMAFFSERFHVLLATVHVPLREVPGILAPEGLARKVQVFFEALQRVGVSRPRLALCGLNPHASEEGLFGEEEKTILEPALRLMEKGLGKGAVEGPFPADSLFHRVLNGDFDGVIALYHDQGLIPLKMVAFDSAVNATLGLPLVRTSPDHGTAFDIAGRNLARPDSMLSAIRWGLRLAPSRP